MQVYFSLEFDGNNSKIVCKILNTERSTTLKGTHPLQFQCQLVWCLGRSSYLMQPKTFGMKLIFQILLFHHRQKCNLSKKTRKKVFNINVLCVAILLLRTSFLQKQQPTDRPRERERHIKIAVSITINVKYHEF